MRWCSSAASAWPHPDSAWPDPFERPVDDRDQLGVEPFDERGERRRLALQHLVLDLPRVRPGKRLAIGQQLVTDRADREQVAAMIERAAFDLLEAT
jgi:hypothetical protein